MNHLDSAMASVGLGPNGVWLLVCIALGTASAILRMICRRKGWPKAADRDGLWVLAAGVVVGLICRQVLSILPVCRLNSTFIHFFFGRPS